MPSRGRESLAQRFLRGYNRYDRRPCPNTRSDHRRRGPRRGPARTSDHGARDAPVRWPCAARRPSSRPSSASASRHPAARQVPASSTSIATGSSSTRCSPAGSGWPPPGVKHPAEDRGRAGVRAARPSARPPGRALADWTRGAPTGCPPTTPRSRSATATRPRWARSISCRPASTRRSPAGTSEGPDADDPALTLDVWRERIRRHPGELKNLLRNQAFVAGIGNAYSDEILCGRGCCRSASGRSLAAEEVDALYEATRDDAAEGDRRAAPARPADVRDEEREFLRSICKGGAAVPALRDADHRGQGRRLRDDVLPRLPALTGGQGSSRTWPTARIRTPGDAGGRGNQKGSWRRPIFPRGYPLSIFGAGELNFRVRDGNGCGLSAGVTRILYEVTT